LGKINKILCKWFDLGNKGYVTIGDFIKGIIFTIIIILMITLVIYSIIEFFTGILSAIEEVPPTLSFFMLGGTIVILFAAFVLIFIISGIIELIKYISDIKIAKCELKNNEQDTSSPVKYSMKTVPLKTEMEEKI